MGTCREVPQVNSSTSESIPLGGIMITQSMTGEAIKRAAALGLGLTVMFSGSKSHLAAFTR